MMKFGMMKKKGTGFLILPSRRCLRDYKNCMKLERGFDPNIMRELRHKVKKLSDKDKFVVLLMDELKTQENLVWDKHNGELIAYVDLGDTDLMMLMSHCQKLPQLHLMFSFS